jgi:hypothetical protein
MVVRELYAQRGCETSTCSPGLNRQPTGAAQRTAHLLGATGTRRNQSVSEDTAYPHPYSMSFHLDRF